MSNTTQSGTTTNPMQHTTAGTQIPFEAINDPGCYICNWNGHLIRVPEDGVAPGRSPLINIIGQEPLLVTKISDNPFIPLTKARLVASNFDCPVNF
jgi:hypothetical protein